MDKQNANQVPVKASSPYTVEIERRHLDEIVGSGNGLGGSVEETLKGMAVFPPGEEHEVVSITRFEGVCLSATMKPRRQQGKHSNEQSSTVTVWAPNEADATELFDRVVRAHFSGPGWWEFDHPNYRRQAGTGTNHE